jgi:hypothetical protein
MGLLEGWRIFTKKEGVVFDLDGLSRGLEGVSELELKLGMFREVFNAGGGGRRVGAPIVGEFRR